MKKKQYIAAVACLAAGIIGFGSVYATEKAQERREAEQLADRQEETQEEDEITEEVSGIVEPVQTPDSEETEEETRQQETAAQEDGPEETQEVAAAEPTDGDEAAQETAAIGETLHFEGSESMVWPLEGNVVLDYSMDSTIYFPTLEQYQYHPAIVIAGNVNDKVYIVAKGRITDISTNEVTGCTVTEDLGDGYSAVYGQLKELNFSVGDLVEAGQVIGYVSEPTKYYSVEGSSLYFQLLKDGEPVNPLDYFE